MIKFFKTWTKFEISFLIISMSLITTCYFLGADKNILSLITSLVGVFSILTVAKGLVAAPIICITYNILYSIISLTQGYYGEAIIYIFLMIPISILSIISWKKNKNKEKQDNVTVNKIKPKEFVYIFLVTILATILFYFLLKLLNTNELIISTVSLISSLMAAYLMLRRSSYYALAYMVNDLILISLWTMSVINNGIEYLPTAITFLIFFVNDTYGFIRWKSEEKHLVNN